MNSGARVDDEIISDRLKLDAVREESEIINQHRYQSTAVFKTMKMRLTPCVTENGMALIRLLLHNTLTEGISRLF